MQHDLAISLRVKLTVRNAALLLSQVADFPPEIFVETAAARELLRAAQLLQPPTQLLEQTPEAAALEFAADEELPSGMVAESLSLLAAGVLDLRPHNVTVSHPLPFMHWFWWKINSCL